MSFEEAMALQPGWLQIWLNVLFIGAYVLPLTLFIWRETRVAAVIVLVASGLGGFAVTLMYNQMGYVKLLGLPHVVFWTPVALYLWSRLRGDNLRRWPRRVVQVILLVIVISLAFDYLDVIRWVLGERTPTISPA